MGKAGERCLETMRHKRRNTFLRILALVVAFVVVLAIILLALDAILPGFVDLIEHGDQQAIIAYIRSFGSFWGVVLAILLQLIQIVSVFFPGGPIQIAVGVVFGTFGGFAICFTGYVLANVAVFFSARKLGNRLEQLFSKGEEAHPRYQFLTNARHPGFVVALTCLIPMLPNGIVPYIAARTKITFWQFLFSVAIGCMPTLLLLNAIGNQLLHGDYFTMALLGGLLVVGVFILYLLRKKIFALIDSLQSAKEVRAEKKRTRSK